jgi:hypothetical protein
MILTERFWSKVTQDGDCWRWTGAISSRGYGQWSVAGTSKSCHRLTYGELRADIPEGTWIDHLCMNRWCCNPWHLEPVSPSVSNKRRRPYTGVRSVCPKGHKAVTVKGHLYRCSDCGWSQDWRRSA